MPLADPFAGIEIPEHMLRPREAEGDPFAGVEVPEHLLTAPPEPAVSPEPFDPFPNIEVPEQALRLSPQTEAFRTRYQPKGFQPPVREAGGFPRPVAPFEASPLERPPTGGEAVERPPEPDVSLAEQARKVLPAYFKEGEAAMKWLFTGARPELEAVEKADELLKTTSVQPHRLAVSQPTTLDIETPEVAPPVQPAPTPEPSLKSWRRQADELLARPPAEPIAPSEAMQPALPIGAGAFPWGPPEPEIPEPIPAEIRAAPPREVFFRAPEPPHWSKALTRDFLTRIPRQFIRGLFPAPEAAFPEKVPPAEWIPEKVVDTVAQIGGNITGILVGVPIIKQMLGATRYGPWITQAARSYPKTAKLINDAVVTGTTFFLRGQAKMPTASSISERVKQGGMDYAIATAFSASHQLRYLNPKVGVPAEYGALMAIGAVGGKTLEEKVVGAATLVFLRSVSQGIPIGKAKTRAVRQIMRIRDDAGKPAYTRRQAMQIMDAIETSGATKKEMAATAVRLGKDPTRIRANMQADLRARDEMAARAKRDPAYFREMWKARTQATEDLSEIITKGTAPTLADIPERAIARGILLPPPVPAVAPTIPTALPTEPTVAPAATISPETGIIPPPSPEVAPVPAEAPIAPTAAPPPAVKALYDIPPNTWIGTTQAKKRPDGKWQLFWRGTRNEIFPGELFVSSAEAKQMFRAEQAKIVEQITKAPEPEAKPPTPAVKTPEVPPEKPAKAYTISKRTITYETRYGVDITPYKWPARKVTIVEKPEKDVLVYQTKSGWIVKDNDTGRSLGKERRGVGWVGFDTPKQAVGNYMKRLAPPEPEAIAPERAAELGGMKLPELRAEAKRLGLKTAGTAKGLKARIQETVGIAKPKIEIEEMKVLKVRLKAEQRASKLGKRVSRVEARKELFMKMKQEKIDIKAHKQSLIDYADANLTKKDRNRLVAMVSRVKTPKQLSRAMTMIDHIEERYQRHVAADALKDTVKVIDFKKLRPEYKPAIQAIADSIDLTVPSDKTVNRLEKLYDYITENPDHNVPDKVVARLARLSKVPIKDLTTPDLIIIDSSIKALVRQHDLKNKILIKRKLRDFKEVRNKAVANIAKKPTPITETREGIRASRIKQIFTTDSLNAEHIAKTLDGEQRGTIKKVVYDGIDDGVSEILRLRQQADDYLGKVTKDVDMTGWSEAFTAKKKNVTYHPYKLEGGKTLTLTKGERMKIANLAHREEGLRHMLEGGIRLRANPAILYRITPTDLKSITDSLSPTEQKIADGIHKYFNTIQKDHLNKTSVRANGWEVATDADYSPIKVHGIDILRPHLLRGEALPSNMRGFMQSTLEGMGMLKPTVRATNPLIVNDIFVDTLGSIKQATAYSGLAEPLRSAKALLLDSTVREAIDTKYGTQYWRSLNNYLRDIEGDYQRVENIDKLALGAINRLDIAVLGANPFVMLKQPVSLQAAATEIDPAYIWRALKEKPTGTETMSKWHPQLRDRFEGRVTRELGEIADVGQARQFWTHKSTISKHLMAGIRRFDFEAIGRIWKAVEHETTALRPHLTGDAKMQHIANRAWEVIRLTQPTFHLKDRSSIGRSKSVWVRLLTKYSSQRNKNFMMIWRTVNRYLNSAKATADRRFLMRSLAILTITMPATIYLIDELRSRLYKRKPPERKGLYRTGRMIENNLGNIYFLGPLARSLSSKVERGEFAGYDVSDVLSSKVETAINGMANTIRAIDQMTTQEKYKAGDKKGELKWETSSKKAIDQAISTTAAFKGIPYDTIKKLLMIPFREDKMQNKKIEARGRPRPERPRRPRRPR